MIEKTNATHRLPHWHAATKRWKATIGFHFGKDGTRKPRPFYFGNDLNEGTPPPAVIAAAVAKQDAWRKTKADWPQLSRKLACVLPERDWSLPVWVDDTLLLRMQAGECAAYREAMNVVLDEERQEAQQAARWFARHGIASLEAMLSGDLSLPTYPGGLPEVTRARMQNRLEVDRATALAELRPAFVRATVRPISVRDAVHLFLKTYDERVELKTSRSVDETTAEVARKRLHHAFGQSANLENPPVRATPIKFDQFLSTVDQHLIERFANFWHGKPEGVESDRTVKNVLNAARQFFSWCQDQPYFGWTFPPPCRPLLNAVDVQREPIPFDPEGISKVIRFGGQRVRMFALFGLCFGHYQQDIVDTAGSEFSTIGDDNYLKRFRSKEPRSKQGRRPIRVRHWLAADFKLLIEIERNLHDHGTLFTSNSGIALTAGTVSKRWFKACRRANVDIPFGQLRKMGFNSIKRLSASLEVADLWDGHAGGVNGSYDDGIFQPVNDAERLWAEELRQHDILKF